MKTISVVAAIIVSGNKVFATQRGYGDYIDKWEFPGGKIEPGEQPEQALKREIREELATEIEVDLPVCTVEHDYPEFHLVMQCFLCHVVEGELELLEHEAARWLDLDNIRSVDWLPADLKVLEPLRVALQQFDPDFDRIINRRGTGCVKYDKVDAGLLPLWVADMDFATPDFIVDALQRRLQHPVLGYPFIPDDYFPTVADWVRNLHGWEVQPEQMCFVPGIVKGIGIAEVALLHKGDKVVIQPPVYHPFRIVSQKNGMEVLQSPLREVCDASGAISGYEMDFDSLEDCFRQGARMLILSNPQNPSGQCWDRDTLVHLSRLAHQYGVLVLSDEIHSEMVLRGRRHIPYASVGPEAAEGSITFMAPSKTFNIAGVVSSYAIIPDVDLRRRFFGFMDANELDYPPIFSIEATLAAYRYGDGWRRRMLRYLESNIDFVCSWLPVNLPRVKALRPGASFLVWLDCRALGLPQEELMRRLEKDAHVYLNDGTMFGEQGEGFVRLNVGCPRIILERALNQIAEALGA